MSGTLQAPATTLHYAPNANLADGAYNASGDPGSIGFNLADVSSQANADSLPAGDLGLLWIGGDSVAQAESIITATANDPKIYGYYVADEPSDSNLPTVLTIDQYIAQNTTSKVSYFVAENDGTPTHPVYAATPSSTDADLIGLDPYPIRPPSEGGAFANGYDYAVIPDAVQEAESLDWQQSQIVPNYQAFGGGGYSSWTLPTTAQEQQILATWSTLTPNPVFDYAYSWGTQDGDNALANTPSLQAVFKQLFAQDSGASPPPPPPPPTIAFSGPSSEPLATSGNTVLVGVGVTSTDATDQMTLTLSDADDALVVDGRSHTAGSTATLTGTPAQVNSDLGNILAGINSGTVDLSATQDAVTQTASISLATVGTPSMTFAYDTRHSENAAAPAPGAGPVVYDIESGGNGTLTIDEFRPGTDVLQLTQGVTVTSTTAISGGLELNLSNHGHIVLAALS